MKRVFAISSLIVLALLVILKEGHQQNPGLQYRDRCMSCHHQLNDPDHAHPLKAFGCASCHLGNPWSLDKERAHVGMVANPGDLRVVDQTCGRPSCHADIVHRVKRGVMATNLGILDSLQENWLEGKFSRVGVRDLLVSSAPKNAAIDQYRKMCAGCHLWKKRGAGQDEISRRGGGCSDCHVPDSTLPTPFSKGLRTHPELTVRIPSANCLKCHNRSARIGLSYFGHYESAGYGTPYHGKGFTQRRLSGRRFFLDVTADVHFRKVGMTCVDCHTATGVMGDGKEYDKMEQQVDITCRACHSPSFGKVADPKSVAYLLSDANRRVPDCRGKSIAWTKRGTPIYNLQLRRGKALFFRKLDGRSVKLDTASGKKPYHMLQGHGRLSCQSCHSSWMPQCYGCHIAYKTNENQRDWLTGEVTKGRWVEGRSYIRFLKPALGLRNNSLVYPISPCQIFLPGSLPENGEGRNSPRKIFTVSAFDPHTTSLRSRQCIDCHGDPKTLGLGEGILIRKNGKWEFRPIYDSKASHLGISFPLDGLMSEEQKMTDARRTDDTRPFIPGEIDRILSVDICIGCHKQYNDKIYQDFAVSLRRFQKDTSLPCRR